MECKFEIYAVVFIVCVLTCAAKMDESCRNPGALKHPQECCPLPELLSEDVRSACEEYTKPPPINDAPRNGNNADEDTSSNDSDESRPRPRPRPHPRPHQRLHPHPHHNSCLMDCFYNETEILNANNELNEDKLTDYLSDTMGDSADLIPIVHESFKTCIEKSVQFKAKMDEKIKNDPKLAEEIAKKKPWFPRCHPQRSYITECVHIETFSNCPASIWKNNDECTATREFVQKCRNF